MLYKQCACNLVTLELPSTLSSSGERTSSAEMPAKDVLSLTPFDASNAKTYDALCHCGTVRYTVALSPPLHEQQVVECNCSLCTRNGYLNVYPYRENVKVTSGQDALKTYTFGSKTILHQFCGRCGSSVFFDPQLPKRGEKMDLVGVNVGACGKGREWILLTRAGENDQGY